MAGIWITYFLLLACAVAYALLATNVFAVVLFVVMIMLPTVFIILNRIIQANLLVKADMQNTCEKNQTVTANFSITNHSIISYRRIRAVVKIENILTGECTQEVIKSALYAKNTAEFSVKFKSSYCGTIKISFKNVRLYDYFGFTYRSMKIDESCCTTVLPEIFTVRITLHSSDVQNLENEAYSSERSGTDISEVYYFRDYVIGDSPKQIQWKLSQKHDRLIVKEGSLPVQNSVLLILNPGKSEDVSAISATAEAVISVGQSLCESGIRFELMWKDGIKNQICCYSIESEEDLSAVLPTLLCAKTTEMSELLPEETEFENVICVTADENIAVTATAYQATVLLVGELLNFKNIISFSPKNIAEDLYEVNV